MKIPFSISMSPIMIYVHTVWTLDAALVVLRYPMLSSVGPSTADLRSSYLLSLIAYRTLSCGERSKTPDCRLTPRLSCFYIGRVTMGRPKVLPANRLRANTACTACRASKKRCSGTFPCANCIHKGRARSCIPFRSVSNTAFRHGPSPSSRQEVEDIAAWEDSSVNLQSPVASHIHNAGTDRQLQRPLEVGSRSPEATHRTHPRMLRNLQGDRGEIRPWE